MLATLLTERYLTLRVELAPSLVLRRLTSSEREIAIALTRGWTRASIARHRQAAAATVSNQIASIFEKLAVSSRSELATRLADVALGSVHAVAARSRSSSPPKPIRVSRPPDDPARVLLLEDVARVREELAAALQVSGYAVDAVGSIDDAASVMAERRHDVALFDVRIGQRSSLDLLRGPEPLPCGVVLMSGAADLGEAIEGLALGAWDFVDKAWGIERVRVALGEAIGTGRTRRPVPALPGDASDPEPVAPAVAARLLVEGRARFAGAIDQDRARHVLFERGTMATLTIRERRALRWALEAAPMKVVAAELGLSEVAAWSLVRATLDHIGFADRVEAIACLAPLAGLWPSEGS